MKFKNGLVTNVERGVPGLPRINHLLMQRACDRFLQKRGLITGASFRKSSWLFGSKRRVAA